MTRERKYTIALLIGIFPFLINGLINPLIVKNIYLFWLFDIFCWVILPIIVITYCKNIFRLEYKDLGFHLNIDNKKNITMLIVLCVFVAFVFYYGTRVFQSVFGFIFMSQPYFDYREVIDETGNYRFFVVLYMSITAGLVEEIYYRSLIFKVASFWKNQKKVFFILSPLLFAIVHWEQGIASVVSAYIVGYFAAYIYYTSRNLWPLIFGHIVTNIGIYI